MAENECPIEELSKVERANKLIERSRKMHAVCLFLSLAVLFAVGASADAEVTDDVSDGLFVFGVNLSFSLLSFFGPAAILGAQAVSLLYIVTMERLLLSDKSLFDKISEPWIFLYADAALILWISVGIFSLLLPTLSLLVTLFIEIEEGGKVAIIASATPYDILKLVISGLLAARTGLSIWRVSLAFEVVPKSE